MKSVVELTRLGLGSKVRVSLYLLILDLTVNSDLPRVFIGPIHLLQEEQLLGSWTHSSSNGYQMLIFS